MKLTIEIDMDNAAFADDGASGFMEASRILEELVINMRNGSAGFGKLRDVNGNTVGKVMVTE